MNSDLLTSSYQRYNSDTNAFLTWLREKATTACDYRPAEIPNPRPPVCAPDTPYTAPISHWVRSSEREGRQEGAKTGGKDMAGRKDSSCSNAFSQICHSQSDKSFAAYCFFEDLHRIEKYVNCIWTEYKRGDVDLVTASFITNAAIEIAKSMEIDLLKTEFPEGLVMVK